jgi:hypothetical protein
MFASGSKRNKNDNTSGMSKNCGQKFPLKESSIPKTQNALNPKINKKPKIKK